MPLDDRNSRFCRYRYILPESHGMYPECKDANTYYPYFIDWLGPSNRVMKAVPHKVVDLDNSVGSAIAMASPRCPTSAKCTLFPGSLQECLRGCGV